MDRAHQLIADERVPETEPHYSIQQIGEMWNLDPTTVRRIFQDQPGVLKIPSRLARRGKRHYITLRVPASVLARIHRERAR